MLANQLSARPPKIPRTLETSLAKKNEHSSLSSKGPEKYLVKKTPIFQALFWTSRSGILHQHNSFSPLPNLASLGPPRPRNHSASAIVVQPCLVLSPPADRIPGPASHPFGFSYSVIEAHLNYSTPPAGLPNCSLIHPHSSPSTAESTKSLSLTIKSLGSVFH